MSSSSLRRSRRWATGVRSHLRSCARRCGWRRGSCGCRRRCPAPRRPRARSRGRELVEGPVGERAGQRPHPADVPAGLEPGGDGEAVRRRRVEDPEACPLAEQELFLGRSDHRRHRRILAPPSRGSGEVGLDVGGLDGGVDLVAGPELHRVEGRGGDLGGERQAHRRCRLGPGRRAGRCRRRPDPTLRALVPAGCSRATTMACGRMTANERPGAASAMTTCAPVSVGQHAVGDDAGDEVGADEVGDVARSGVGGDLGDRADLDDPAGIEDRDPVGERVGIDRIVGDQHAHAVERVEVAAQVAADAARGCRRRARRAARRAAAAADRWPAPGPARPAGPGRPTAARGRWLAWSARPTRSSQSPARRVAPPPWARRGPAARTRRSRARSGGRTAGSPGTRRRSGAARPARTRPSAGSSRTWSSIAIRPRSIGSSPASARSTSTCRRRSVRGSRAPRPGSTLELDVEVEGAELQADRCASRLIRLRAPGGAAEPPVAQPDEHGERHGDQHQAEDQCLLRVRSRAPGRSPAASSAWCRGSCRRT